MLEKLHRLPGWRRLILVAALAAGGCGYRFTAGGGALPSGARSLYVPVFHNATTEAGAEAWFTEALRTELARRGLEGGEASDAVVVGAVTEISDGAAIHANASPICLPVPASATVLRVRASATVRLMRGEETLREVKVSGEETYEHHLGAGSIIEDEANRRVALRRLAARLMRDAFERLQTF